jgi:hypothetical protein
LVVGIDFLLTSGTINGFIEGTFDQKGVVLGIHDG